MKNKIKVEAKRTSDTTIEVRYIVTTSSTILADRAQRFKPSDEWSDDQIERLRLTVESFLLDYQEQIQ